MFSALLSTYWIEVIPKSLLSFHETFIKTKKPVRCTKQNTLKQSKSEKAHHETGINSTHSNKITPKTFNTGIDGLKNGTYN